MSEHRLATELVNYHSYKSGCQPRHSRAVSALPTTINNSHITVIGNVYDRNPSRKSLCIVHDRSTSLVIKSISPP